MNPEEEKERETATNLFNSVVEMIRNADEDERWELVKEKQGQTRMKIQAHKHVYTKTQCEMPFSCQKVVSFLSDPNNISSFDPTTEKVELIKTYPENIQLIYNKFKVGTESREIVFVQGVHTDPDNVTCVACKSMNYDQRPEEVPRVNVNMEGFVVRPITENSCTVSWIVKMETEGLNTDCVNRLEKDQGKMLPRISTQLSGVA